MSGVKHTPVLIATSSAADGVYVISQGEERKAIGTVRAPRSLVDTMCAAPDLLEAVDHPLLREVMGFVEDAAPDEVIATLRQWQDTQRAAIARARGEQDGGGE